MFERIKNAVGSLGAARAAADSLASLDRDLRDRHEAAVRRIRNLARQPEPVDAIVANMRNAVDATGARYAAEYGVQLVNAFSRKIAIGDDLVPTVEPPAPSWGPSLRPPSWDQMCWLAPDGVKAAFERSIRASHYEAGLPIDERRAAIRAAQDEVSALETEHEALVDDAAKSGIGLQHLPSVAARREAAARREELEAHAAQARRRLSQKVDEVYPATRLGRSQYLATQGAPAPRVEGRDRTVP